MELLKLTWKLIVDLFGAVGININTVLIVLVASTFFILTVPSITRSIAARTSGRLTRTIRGATTPYYGKKGTGIYKSPSRTVRNKSYRRRSKKLF